MMRHPKAFPRQRSCRFRGIERPEKCPVDIFQWFERPENSPVESMDALLDTLRVL
jgi:hypothetical protein